MLVGDEWRGLLPLPTKRGVLAPLKLQSVAGALVQASLPLPREEKNSSSPSPRSYLILVCTRLCGTGTGAPLQMLSDYVLDEDTLELFRANNWLGDRKGAQPQQCRVGHLVYAADCHHVSGLYLTRAAYLNYAADCHHVSGLN